MRAWTSTTPALALLALAALACTSRAQVDPPALDGYQTLLHGPPGASALTAVALTDAALRVELEAELVGDAYAELLLYRAPLAALDLPTDGGRVTLSDDGQPLPAPDAAWSLGEALDWRPEDPAPWAARRVAAACLAPSVASVELGIGKPLFMERWGEDAVVVGMYEPPTAAPLPGNTGGVLRLHVVRPSGSARAPLDLTSVSVNDYLHGTLDDRGHLWMARTSSIGGRAALVLVEVDAALERAREQVVATDLPLDDAAVADVVAGHDAAGRAEVFVLYSPHDRSRPARVLRWREGEAGVFALPWPVGPALSACSAVGIYRTHLAWEGPDTISFLFRQGVVQRWRGGALEGELADDRICGGAVLDDRVEAGALMVLQPERQSELPASPPRVLRRDAGGDWVRLGEAPLVNAMDLVRWRGRELASGDGGQLYELQARRSGVDVCAAIRTEPPNNRVDRMVVVGDRLAMVGAAHEGDPVRVFWLGL